MKRTVIFGIAAVLLVGGTASGETTAEKTMPAIVNADAIGSFGITEGEWFRIERIPFSESAIKISEVTDTSFRFEMVALSGSHFGEVSGSANHNGGTWIFEDNEYGDRIVFTMSGDTLRLQFIGNIADYAGEGVGFDGDYIKGLAKQKLTLAGLGILSEPEDRGFKRLVGNDYELFVNSFNLVSEKEDLDNRNAKVFAGGARGLPTIVEAIIMVSPKQKFWAAVIDGDSVKYYTNVKSSLKRLPRTIDSWREGFQDKEVIFSSR